MLKRLAMWLLASSSRQSKQYEPQQLQELPNTSCTSERMLLCQACCCGAPGSSLGKHLVMFTVKIQIGWVAAQ